VCRAAAPRSPPSHPQTDPVTGAPLTSLSVLPNVTLRQFDSPSCATHRCPRLAGPPARILPPAGPAPRWTGRASVARSLGRPANPGQSAGARTPCRTSSVPPLPPCSRVAVRRQAAVPRQGGARPPLTATARPQASLGLDSSHARVGARASDTWARGRRQGGGSESEPGDSEDGDVAAAEEKVVEEERWALVSGAEAQKGVCGSEEDDSEAAASSPRPNRKRKTSPEPGGPASSHTAYRLRRREQLGVRRPGPAQLVGPPYPWPAA
jgi:hypothetical protein